MRRAVNNARVLIVLPAAFFFGGLVQIIVTIMEFSWYHAAGDIIESTFARKVLSFAPRRSGNRTRSPAAARSRSPLDSACHRPYRQVVAHATRRWIPPGSCPCLRVRSLAVRPMGPADPACDGQEGHAW